MVWLGRFLGTNAIAPQHQTFLSYEEASKVVIKLGIKTHGQWSEFKNSKGFHKYKLPKAPEIVYKKRVEWLPCFFGKKH